MSKPLIVHIIYALGTGGLENGLINIINRTPAQRYRHAIICLTDTSDFAKRIQYPGVAVYTLHKRPGQDWRLYGRVLAHLRRLKPAIVHTRNLAALEMQAVTLLLPGVKRVHGEHGRDIYDLQGSNRRYNLLRQVLGKCIHRFICVSQDLQQWLVGSVGIPADKVVQIYNGVDHQQFTGQRQSTPQDLPPWLAQTNTGPRPQILGTVGRAAAVKDQKTLISAFAKLRHRQPEVPRYLVIVGDGPLFAELTAQVAALELTPYVWLAGDRDDVAALLARMDVFVLPSLGEGISNTVLEAMASGLPVVASRVGGNPELVDDQQTGCLVAPGQPDVLADTLAALLADPARLQAMGQAGQAKVQRLFDWDKSVAQYFALYDQLLSD